MTAHNSAKVTELKLLIIFICCADMHMVQLMLLPLTVSCFSKIHIGLTFLVLAHLGSPGKGC